MKRKVINHLIHQDPTPCDVEWQAMMNNVRFHEFDLSGKFCSFCRFNNTIEVWSVETIRIPMLFMNTANYVSKDSVCIDLFWSQDSQYLGAVFGTFQLRNKTATASASEGNNYSTTINTNNKTLLDVQFEFSTFLVWNVSNQHLQYVLRYEL